MSHTLNVRADDILLNVLIFQQGPFWVAQCLEHDINSQGTSIDQALDRLECILSISMEIDAEENKEPLKDIPPAPAKYMKMFLKAVRLDKRQPIIEIRTQGPKPWEIKAITKETRIQTS